MLAAEPNLVHLRETLANVLVVLDASLRSPASRERLRSVFEDAALTAALALVTVVPRVSMAWPGHPGEEGAG